MLTVENPKDLLDRQGEKLGQSAWRTIGQAQIDQYAGAIGEFHWIHVDPARASRESPTGTTIAHGFHSLSLLVPLLGEVLTIDKAARWLVYGVDRVRFPAPVPSGASIRLDAAIKDAVALPGDGVRVTIACTLELTNSEKPAAVADFILAIFP